MKQTVQAGTQITADMVETVSVPENLIENGISDAAIAVGQYAAADLYGGDYLTTPKLTDTLAEQSLFSAGEAKRKMVVSVTLPSLASGVSGRLLPGDIATVIAIPKGSVNSNTGRGTGRKPSRPVRTLIRCWSTSRCVWSQRSDGADASVEAQPDDDIQNTLPVTVSFYATREQALKLAELEQTGIHLAFVARGEAVSQYMPDSVLAGLEVD